MRRMKNHLRWTSSDFGLLVWGVMIGGLWAFMYAYLLFDCWF